MGDDDRDVSALVVAAKSSDADALGVTMRVPCRSDGDCRAEGERFRVAPVLTDSGAVPESLGAAEPVEKIDVVTVGVRVGIVSLSDEDALAEYRPVVLTRALNESALLPLADPDVQGDAVASVLLVAPLLNDGDSLDDAVAASTVPEGRGLSVKSPVRVTDALEDDDSEARAAVNVTLPLDETLGLRVAIRGVSDTDAENVPSGMEKLPETVDDEDKVDCAVAVSAVEALTRAEPTGDRESSVVSVVYALALRLRGAVRLTSPADSLDSAEADASSEPEEDEEMLALNAPVVDALDERLDRVLTEGDGDNVKSDERLAVGDADEVKVPGCGDAVAGKIVGVAPVVRVALGDPEPLCSADALPL